MTIQFRRLNIHTVDEKISECSAIMVTGSELNIMAEIQTHVEGIKFYTGTMPALVSTIRFMT